MLVTYGFELVPEQASHPSYSDSSLTKLRTKPVATRPDVEEDKRRPQIAGLGLHEYTWLHPNSNPVATLQLANADHRRPLIPLR